MEDLSLHVLDVIENGIRAGASEISLILTENSENNTLTVTIRDNGCGIDEETLGQVSDPFYSSKEGKEFGLGISLLSQAAENTGGYVTVDSIVGEGTEITALFHSDHIDMKPLGDMDLTLDLLRMSHGSIRFMYERLMI
ncbi:MAG: ATP-binding protein [Spirochaetaceae bacterium]|nr:ATP-binding protein [Spirochaetaceae bacterium]